MKPMTWRQALDVLSKNHLRNLQETIAEERKEHHVYPKKGVLRALRETPLSQVKVVILGADHYHSPGDNHQGIANGLAFCVNEGKASPPSLTNIYSEMATDLWKERGFGMLELTTKQGVLLFNTALTVVEGKPSSHMSLWTNFRKP